MIKTTISPFYLTSNLDQSVFARTQPQIRSGVIRKDLPRTSTKKESFVFVIYPNAFTTLTPYVGITVLSFCS